MRSSGQFCLIRSDSKRHACLVYYVPVGPDYKAVQQNIKLTKGPAERIILCGQKGGQSKECMTVTLQRFINPSSQIGIVLKQFLFTNPFISLYPLSVLGTFLWFAKLIPDVHV